MPVLQQYYTSYSNEIARNVGYQVKATTPGITPQLQQAIDHLISYRIPPSMDERAIDTHPVALRYMYDSEMPNKSIFLCSQSIGNDVNGRPGNFFAHTVVTEPDIFASVPPILYWKSSFWKNKDTEARARIDSLDVLPTFNAEPAFDIEGMWEFLDQGKRREWLYKLLCAVIHCKRTYRRIVLLDTTDNVVWWIAIISSLLPPDYRPLLSFATYFHDPALSPFMIAGITKDAFRSSPDMYSSYFVLNTWEDRYSEVEGSLYAEVVTSEARPETYFEQLLPLLAFAKRFPKPTAIDEQLDRVMLYAKMQTGRAPAPLSPEELMVVEQAVQSIAQLPDLRPEEADELNPLEELEHLRGILADALRLQPSPAIAAISNKVNQLLQTYKSDQELQTIHERVSELEKLADFTPEQVEALEHVQVVLSEMIGTQRSPVLLAQAERVNSLLKKYWARNAERVQHDLKAFVENLLQSQEPAISGAGWNQLRQAYRDALLGEEINQPVFLSWLVEVLMQYQSLQVLLVWQYIGKYIQPGVQSQSLLVLSLNVVQRLWNSQRMSDANQLCDVMLDVMAGNEFAWLELAMSSNAQLAQEALPTFYYKLVSHLELDQRLPYRQVIARLYGLESILQHEIANDVYNADIQQGIRDLEHWVRHARQHGYDAPALLDVALKQLEKQCTPQQWRELATAILVNNNLLPLPPEIEERLVALVMPAFSLSMKSISPADVELCRKYQYDQSLSEDTRTTLATILAMTSGTMDKTLAQRIQAQVKILLPHEYVPGVQRFLQMFFQHDVMPEAHRWAVAAFFTRAFGYDGHFWQAYQATLGHIFLHPATTMKAVVMLDFWFTARPIDFLQPQLYIVQEFFLKLSPMLTNVQQSNGFFAAAQEFTNLAGNQSWYPVVQVYFPEKEKVLGALGGAFNQRVIAPVLQKLNPNPGRELEGRKQRLAGKVEALFEKKRAVAQHELLSREYYDPPLREQFWAYYWQQFRKLLIEGEVNVVLDILSFWFDTAYQTQNQANYLPQTFFLGFLASSNGLYSLTGFRDAAQRIEEKIATQKKDLYPWYPLVRNYFTVPDSRK